jgi:hypothetical protein
MGCGEVGPHVITVTGNVVRGSEESPGIERAEITLDISAVTLPKAKERLGEDHPVVVLYEETLGSLAALVEEAKAMKAEIKMLRFRALGSFYRQGFDAGELAATQPQLRKV